MAVTAHFFSRNASKRLDYQSLLVAFSPVNDSHSGQNLAINFLGILDRLGVAHKVSSAFTASRFTWLK